MDPRIGTLILVYYADRDLMRILHDVAPLIGLPKLALVLEANGFFHSPGICGRDHITDAEWWVQP